MRFLSLLGVAFLLALGGCASNPMQTASSSTPLKPAPDQAQVVFMRDTIFGSAVRSSLYDVTTDKTEFIGVMANATKIAYPTTPGKHVFMVVSEAADFMEADLRPGKTYYALVVPRVGGWRARFSLWPISQNAGARYSLKSKDFAEWVSDTRLVENTPKSFAWYEENKESVESKRREYWEVWQDKTAEAIETRTLKPEDGQGKEGE